MFNARFVKPLDEAAILELAASHDRILLAEENVVAGGFSSAVLELLADKGALAQGKRIKRLGVPDRFVEHGPQKVLRQRLGIDKEGVKRALRELARE